MTPTEIATSLYRAFAEADETLLLEVVDADIEWIQCDGFPGGAHRHGIAEVVRGVFFGLRSEWDGWRVEIDEYLEIGNAVVALGRYLGTHGRTGREMKSVFAHVIETRAGKIVRFRQIADTAPIVDAARAQEPCGAA